MNIAIFASGSGSNAENIIRYFRAKGGAESHSFVVVCNNKDAYVLTRAASLGVPSVCFPKAEFLDGGKVGDFLAERKIEFIVLAGFLLKIPDSILAKFPDRIVNIHPSLLPKYGGKGMFGHHVHEAVVAGGDRKSGISIHFVNDQYDRGELIFQAECDVAPGDTPDDVAAKVHELEMANFPRVIDSVISSVRNE